MKMQYITPGCEIMPVGKQDIIRTSGLSVKEGNGGIVLNWELDDLS